MTLPLLLNIFYVYLVSLDAWRACAGLGACKEVGLG